MGIFDLFKNIAVGNTNLNRLVSLDTSRKISNDWSIIEQMLKGSTPSQLKQAVITADKIMDNALKEISSGDSMSERLKNMRERLDNGTYQRMWDAHKLRNNLVHELSFEPQHFVLREAVHNIKNVLIKIGINL